MAGYGTDEGFTAWAVAAGRTLPAGIIAGARQRGSVFIDGTYVMRFPGEPVGGIEQERAWPRVGATDRYGKAIDPGTVPNVVVLASYEAAFAELTTPGSLSPVVIASQRVVREKVEGAVEVEYSRPSGGTDAVAEATPVLPVIEGLLAPLLIPTNIPYPLVV